MITVEEEMLFGRAVCSCVEAPGMQVLGVFPHAEVGFSGMHLSLGHSQSYKKLTPYILDSNTNKLMGLCFHEKPHKAQYCFLFFFKKMLKHGFVNKLRLVSNLIAILF